MPGELTEAMRVKATTNVSGFHRICALLAARSLYESGTGVQEIATQANRSKSTIHRWLREAGARKSLHSTHAST